jgi:hypothetical protein
MKPRGLTSADLAEWDQLARKPGDLSLSTMDYWRIRATIEALKAERDKWRERARSAERRLRQ